MIRHDADGQLAVGTGVTVDVAGADVVGSGVAGAVVVGAAVVGTGVGEALALDAVVVGTGLVGADVVGAGVVGAGVVGAGVVGAGVVGAGVVGAGVVGAGLVGAGDDGPGDGDGEGASEEDGTATGNGEPLVGPGVARGNRLPGVREDEDDDGAGTAGTVGRLRMTLRIDGTAPAVGFTGVLGVGAFGGGTSADLVWTAPGERMGSAVGAGQSD